MNKSDLIDHISQSAEVSKQAADRALSATLDGIRQALKKGKVVQIIGFGTFSVGRRAGRTGRNPRTGELIPIAARRVVTFHASSKLKELIQGEGSGS